MSVERLKDIPGFNIDRIAAAAGDGPGVLRMENLDTEISPPRAALEATRQPSGVWKLRLELGRRASAARSAGPHCGGPA